MFKLTYLMLLFALLQLNDIEASPAVADYKNHQGRLLTEVIIQGNTRTKKHVLIDEIEVKVGRTLDQGTMGVSFGLQQFF